MSILLILKCTFSENFTISYRFTRSDISTFFLIFPIIFFLLEVSFSINKQILINYLVTYLNARLFSS